MSEPLLSEEIRMLLPHRFPMLLVDKVLEIEPGKRAVGLKNVTINEPFFQGHFPEMAVMPGVLILESLAQVAGIMMLACNDYRDKIPFIASIDSARFYRPVVPGDSMIIEATVDWVRSMVGKIQISARVEGVLVVKSEMKFALKDPPKPDAVVERLAGFGPFSAGPGGRRG